ncbi:MAG: hypothetical protein ACLGHI_00255 [Gammaproteobacteria bacterium]
METMMRFHKAFEAGLKADFGEIVGKLLGDAIGYFPSSGLKHEALKKNLEEDSALITSSIKAGNVDGGTLLKIRSNVIASALLGDTKSVEQWSRIGLEWSDKVLGGGWNETFQEWQWIIANTEDYSQLISDLKRFLHQI